MTSLHICSHLSTKVIFNGKLFLLRQQNDDAEVLFTKGNTKYLFYIGGNEMISTGVFQESFCNIFAKVHFAHSSNEDEQSICSSSSEIKCSSDTTQLIK